MPVSAAQFQVPAPSNEPIQAYAPGNPARESLQRRLEAMAKECPALPNVIGGRETPGTGEKRRVVMPHSHREAVGEFAYAGAKELEAAAAAALAAKPAWEGLPWEDRAAIFLKAADLLSGPWRDTLNAATMLGQSKNAYQAEIDSACELIDFFRFNAHFYGEILKGQPISGPGTWNRTDYRPLEGFVLAITPFNFTAIAGNLPAAPALLGNTVVWKPSDTQMLAAHYTLKLLEAAGLPPGVINLVAADGPEAGRALLPHRELAGVHFTGSTATFRAIWGAIGQEHRQLPRLSADRRRDGGKGFRFRPPLRGSGGARHRFDPRRFRVPRAKMLGGLRAPTCREASGRACAKSSSTTCGRSRWATCATSRIS